MGQEKEIMGAEPFKIKMVEPIRLIPRVERVKRMEEAYFNVFRLKPDDVYIDLLTDSGTSAMSDYQWAGLMMGDESYAGSRNFYHLEQVVQDLMGFRYVIPTHQGRPAENILFSALIQPGQMVPGNAHFDTTAAHIRHKKGIPVNLPIPEALRTGEFHPFKGNVNIGELEALLNQEGKNIPFFLMTITNNTGGGQPVSMENIRKAREITSKYRIPLYFDAARFAENAYFIKEREEGYRDRSIKAIVKEMMSHGDGCVMSAKKDGLVNMGGFICTNDEGVYQRCGELLILMEGFLTYGGLSGRDLEVMARGLEEVVSEDYLTYRIRQVRYLGERLMDAGIPIIHPTGGHAVYIDGRAFLPHIPQSQFPAQVTSVELYMEAGVRSLEIGTVAFARKDEKTGETIYPPLDLTRLAIPRRVYTDRHMDVVAEGVIRISKRKESIRGLKINWEPKVLRHFLAKFSRV
ncbi:MAG: tryptophanase [Syntrophaceae bacterium]|nr:tryptophanase [Syntrophaceae bacterium]